MEIIIENYKSTVKHDANKKRRLIPDEKEEWKKNLRGKSALELRNAMAASVQNQDLPERPDIPTLNAMHLMKSRDQCSAGLNAFEALDELKNIHVNSIHKIGYDPFFVIYETPAQSEYYAKDRLKRRTVVSIDATGPGVKSPTSNPKCIYLYAIVLQGISDALYSIHIKLHFHSALDLFIVLFTR